MKFKDEYEEEYFKKIHELQDKVDDYTDINDFKRDLDDLEKKFEDMGMVTPDTRLRIIQDKIDNPNTPSEVRWEFLMCLMDYWLPNNDVFKWMKRLENLTEGYLNDARE